jgi:hypothetical protein
MTATAGRPPPRGRHGRTGLAAGRAGDVRLAADAQRSAEDGAWHRRFDIV